MSLTSSNTNVIILIYEVLYHLTNKKNDKIIEVDELERFMILLKSVNSK